MKKEEESVQIREVHIISPFLTVRNVLLQPNYSDAYVRSMHARTQTQSVSLTFYFVSLVFTAEVDVFL